MPASCLIQYFQNGFCFLIALKQRVEDYPNRRPLCKPGPLLVFDYISLLKAISQRQVYPESDTIMSAQNRNEEFYQLR
jgi:hypothetical protein